MEEEVCDRCDVNEIVEDNDCWSDGRISESEEGNVMEGIVDVVDSVTREEGRVVVGAVGLNKYLKDNGQSSVFCCLGPL